MIIGDDNVVTEQILEFVKETNKMLESIFIKHGIPTTKEEFDKTDFKVKHHKLERDGLFNFADVYTFYKGDKVIDNVTFNFVTKFEKGMMK